LRAKSTCHSRQTSLGKAGFLKVGEAAMADDCFEGSDFIVGSPGGLARRS